MEVHELIQEAYERAEVILREYRPQLDAIAQQLIDVETLERKQFEEPFAEPVTPKNGGTPIPVAA